MVSVPCFFYGEKFLRKKAQSAGKENNSGMVEENLHGESIPDMVLRMDGEIEKESIKVSLPTSQTLRTSKDSDVTDKEGCTR